MVIVVFQLSWVLEFFQDWMQCMRSVNAMNQMHKQHINTTSLSPSILAVFSKKALDRLAKRQCFGFDWVPFLYSSLSKYCATNTLLLALMVVYHRIPSILSQAPSFSTSTSPYMWGTENPVLNLFPTAMLPKQQGNRHVFNEGIIWKKKFHLSASLLLSVVTSCFCCQMTVPEKTY